MSCGLKPVSNLKKAIARIGEGCEARREKKNRLPPELFDRSIFCQSEDIELFKLAKLFPARRPTL